MKKSEVEAMQRELLQEKKPLLSNTLFRAIAIALCELVLEIKKHENEP